MIDDTIRHAWSRLHADPELGAGNFLFKAYEAYPDRQTPFLTTRNVFVAPDGVARRSFGYDDLRETVGALAAWYLGQGVGRGAFVALYLREGIDSFFHFLALNSIGATPVLVNGNLRAEVAARYAVVNRFATFVFDGETRERAADVVAHAALRTLDASFVAGRREPGMAALDSGWPVQRRADDIVMICHSSGTTGIPKAVVFGHAQFMQGKRERLHMFVEQDDDRMLTAMPTTHAAGISYLMTAVLLRLQTHSIDSLLGSAAAEEIAAFRPTVVTGFPQTWESIAALRLPDAAFASVRRFYNTADSAHGAHIRALFRLAPQARFTDMFGASELGMSQFFKVSRPDAIAEARSVGFAAEYADCRILSPQGELLADGEIGYFGVRSPTITPGYFGQERLTTLTRLAGYWLTGDVGFRRPSGEFIHLDRIVDVIRFVDGRAVYTLPIEEHLLRDARVHDVTVVGVNRGPANEQAVVAVVRPAALDDARGSAAIDAATVMAALREVPGLAGHGLDAYSACVAILAPEAALPVGATGKVIKRAVKDGFWDAQRDYDRGDVSHFTELTWNHEHPVPHTGHSDRDAAVAEPVHAG